MFLARVDAFVWRALSCYRNKLKYHYQKKSFISAGSGLIKLSFKIKTYILKNGPDFVLENSRFPFRWLQLDIENDRIAIEYEFPRSPQPYR